MAGQPGGDPMTARVVRMLRPEPGDVCATCTGPLPTLPTNANYFVQTGKGRFGGHYERRWFCSQTCVNTAPKYVAPKRPRQPRPQPVAYGDWAQLGAFLGHQPRKGRR